MQVTKCDRCGAIYQPTKPALIPIIDFGEEKGEYITRETKERFLNCSRLAMTNHNRDYDLCEKCTEEILASFKGEND